MVIEEDLLTGGGGFGVFIELLRVIGAPVCLDTGIPTNNIRNVTYLLTSFNKCYPKHAFKSDYIDMRLY